MPKVIVGMSGGVDSAIAALILKNQGYDVVGVTLRTWVDSDGQEGRCCEIDDARKTAWKIGIPYYTFNCISDFEKEVISPFINDYLNGLTPNPCVICNRRIKFDRLINYADILQAEYIATGHYAYVIKLDNGRYTVKKASHADKDQTYMLYRLSQEQLSRTLMPLGSYSKQEVRELAEKAGLHVASKPDSQEICFVTDGNYADYIGKNAKTDIPGPGNFVDENGKILGVHKGIMHYTVGQRKGLGLALGYPAYIKKISADTNEIIVGRGDDLFCRSLICKDVNFMGIPGLDEGEKYECKVKVRYHHQNQNAYIENCGEGLVKVVFDQPVKSAAPGQSAVFYDENDCVAGGGIISEVIFENESK